MAANDAGAHEAVVVTESQVDAVGTADLVRFVVHAVEGAGRYTVDSRNLDASLHENVEHAAVNCPRKLPPSRTSATLPAFFALLLRHVDLLRLRFGFLLTQFWDGESAGFFEAASEAESVSQFEARFRDALSAWTAAGKARPVLSADSGMNFPLAIHLETASHSERGFRDVLSA